MPDRRSKDELFEGFAAVAKALSSGRRIQLLDVLAQSERSVEELATELGQSLANTSHHLRALAQAGLVRARREGTRVIYRPSSERAEALVRVIQEAAAEHLGEIERLTEAFLGDRTGLERITAAELMRRLRHGAVTVLDVRPASEYEAGHIAGARSIPIGELSRRLRSVPRDGEVIAYCRGPYCVFADEAVRLLKRKGFRARRLEEGFPEWRRAGLPVEEGGPGRKPTKEAG